MRPDHRQPGAAGGAARDHRHRTAGHRAAGPTARTNTARHGDAWSAVTQVVDHRLADIGGQRQLRSGGRPCRGSRPLPARQSMSSSRSAATSPGAQPEAHQQDQDREITPADRTVAVAAGQQRRDLRGATPAGSAASRGLATAGTAADRSRGAIPATNRNRSKHRSGLSIAFIDPTVRSRAWARHERGHLRGREIVKIKPAPTTRGARTAERHPHGPAPCDGARRRSTADTAGRNRAAIHRALGSAGPGTEAPPTARR